MFFAQLYKVRAEMAATYSYSESKTKVTSSQANKWAVKSIDLILGKTQQ